MKILIYILPAIFYLLMGALGEDFLYSIFLGSIVLFFYCYILSLKIEFNFNVIKKIIFTIILLHIIFIAISLIIKGIDKTNFISLLHTLPYVIAVLFFYIFNKTSSKSKKIFIFLMYLILVYNLNNYIPQLVFQKLHFNNYIGKTEMIINISKIPFIKNQNDSLNGFGSGNEILILDFWNNGCGSCFKKFPKFNSLFLKNKHNTKLKFYSVNVYKSIEEIEKGNKLISKYNFNNVFLNDKFKTDFSLEAYPTVIVIKKNRIIFKGTIETLTNFESLYLK